MDWTETLQVTRYLEGQNFDAHYDWAEDPSQTELDIESRYNLFLQC